MVTLTGPKRKKSCCHWHVNSILAQNKLPLIIKYNTVQKYEIPSQRLTWTCELMNFFFLIPGYLLLRTDHPKSIKKGGVWLHFKEIPS